MEVPVGRIPSLQCIMDRGLIWAELECAQAAQPLRVPLPLPCMKSPVCSSICLILCLKGPVHRTNHMEMNVSPESSMCLTPHEEGRRHGGITENSPHGIRFLLPGDRVSAWNGLRHSSLQPWKRVTNPRERIFHIWHHGLLGGEQCPVFYNQQRCSPRSIESQCFRN